MKQITLIAVGKMDAALAPAFSHYTKRLQRLCRWEVKELPEARLPARNASAAEIAAALDKEGQAILSALPKAAAVVALCVEGSRPSSEDFAEKMAQMALSGHSQVAFVIGSSHGLAPAVKAKADFLLSLSNMTLPHQLARIVLAEQIYRAFSINNNTQYHK